MNTTFQEVDTHLDQFVDTIPKLEDAWNQFRQKSQDLVQERNKVTRVLDYQNVLVDLLELPQLMETLVWNGYYTEAMDLAAHVRRLHIRYPLAIMDDIQQQIQASSDVMLVQLIAHLRRPIKLAAAMNVIGYLRRMDVISSDTDLRLVFLRCRHDFLELRLENLRKSFEHATTSSPLTATPTETSSSTSPLPRRQDMFDYLKRYIDIMREQIFEMATQCMSIFSAKEPDTILADYMVHLIGEMQQSLTDHLAVLDDTSALASLLTQVQYCGMSLGRVGLDFRLLFVQAFQKAIEPLVLRLMDQALTSLTQTLEPILSSIPPPNTWLLPASTYSLATKSLSDNQLQASDKQGDGLLPRPFQPPLLLVDYPCLAAFTNGILTSFNALRLIPALHLADITQQHLTMCLMKVAHLIKQYADQANALYPDQADIVTSFVTAYTRSCVPYLQRCLAEGIYKKATNPSIKSDLNVLFKEHFTMADDNATVSPSLDQQQPSAIHSIDNAPHPQADNTADPTKEITGSNASADDGHTTDDPATPAASLPISDDQPISLIDTSEPIALDKLAIE
ncbi:hypothetical protein DM01DRAFT_1340028 [Hesseltinella vesiculosa]|uniref:Conserved oligomeric Golgi complex subunit 8 n=1 Tax=Hesseltinella vesiculosa TaxID=101127 RepID=A0A1X2G5F8_9FUNG|nr:hypothetical protein DM01DRAFT_1340028 [Hesseltinella vesiculosa]